MRPSQSISALCSNSIGANDGHQSHYKWSWLRARLDTRNPDAIEYSHNPPKAIPALIRHREIHWCYNVAVDPPTIEYEDVMHNNEGVAKWTSLIVCIF